VGSKETTLGRGRRVADQVTGRLLGELKHARMVANLSVRAVAAELGWSHMRYVRLE
jgi:hypothetical protein